MSNLVIYEGGKTLTSSRRVAEKFGKRHSNVIRDIQEMQLPDNYLRLNFELVEYIDAKGERRPEYIITRDGFTLLAMGFTGKKAMSFKIEFIEAFNSMEAALKSDAWMLESMTPHTDKVNQKNNTKLVANSFYSKGGTEAVKKYHTTSTKLHAGCSVKAIKDRFLEIENNKRKAEGRKVIKSTPSAKEILRIFKPEIAAAMSVTDSMCKSGHKLEDVAIESRACIPLFKRLIESKLNEGKKIC